jgi:hypothetical protein
MGIGNYAYFQQAAPNRQNVADSQLCHYRLSIAEACAVFFLPPGN